MKGAATPPWLAIARSKIGVLEAPGAKNSPTIMEWAKRVGPRQLGIEYSADAVPWCGLFMAFCMVESGIVPPKIAVRAKSWADWGSRLTVPVIGSVVVFERPGGGHVGFPEGERDDAYLVLGGNQSDAVSRAWIAKNRCIAVRWPPGAVADLYRGAPLPRIKAGGPLSENER